MAFGGRNASLEIAVAAFLQRRRNIASATRNGPVIDHTPDELSDADVVRPLSPRPDWIEVRPSGDFCTLCGNFATEGHLASSKHQRLLEYHERPVPTGHMPGPNELSPEHWGDPSHFELRDKWWWCRLCNQWADDCHVSNRKHLKRTESGSQWHHRDGRALPALNGVGADENVWDSRVRGSVYTAPGGTVGVQRSPWLQAWSDEHQEHYYWHEITRATCWDPPPDCEDELATKDTPVSPAAAIANNPYFEQLVNDKLPAATSYDHKWC